jgi:NADH-quinone oxidoreductase subunit L
MENGPYELIKFVFLLPLLGFLVQAIFGGVVVRRLGPTAGKRLMGSIAVGVVALAFGIGAFLLLTMLKEPPSSRTQVITLCPWIELEAFRAPIEFLLDPLSLTMVLIITGVGALIHLYATGYMAEDKDFTRFFTYMNLFVASMLLLVLANNLILLFVGWEGVGLCSYLLIGFWYKDLDNSKAANKAFIVNRIGDFGFMLGMFLLFCVMVSAKGGSYLSHGYLNFDGAILDRVAGSLAENPWVATPLALLLFVGAMGKSAQFPLYVWLPDAMAGPTPVSALIHAATMVTSGIFLLNRLWPIFAASPQAGVIIAVVGAFTALYAAVIAFGQTDIKKVLAFSTVSQLGYMFLACGAGNYSAGMFHVTTHAFFKALLFLGAGTVIHAMAHNQDMRNYGNLRKYLPITFYTMMVGYLAIAGFPLLSGFYSKDEILKAAIGSPESVVRIAGFAGLFTAFLTALYMGRLTFLTFFGDERWRTAPTEALQPAHHEAPEPAVPPAPNEDPNGFFFTDAELAARATNAESDHEHHESLGPGFTPHEVPGSMAFPLVILAILSAGAGFLLNGPFEKWLYPDGITPEVQFAAVPWVMWASIGAALLGIGIGYAVYASGLPPDQGWDLAKWNPFRKAAGAQFYFDHAVSEVGGEAGRLTGRVMNGADRGLVEGTVDAVGFVAEGFGLVLRKLQSGFVRAYALLMLLGVLALVGYLIYAAKGLAG